MSSLHCAGKNPNANTTVVVDAVVNVDPTAPPKRVLVISDRLTNHQNLAGAVITGTGVYTIKYDTDTLESVLAGIKEVVGVKESSPRHGFQIPKLESIGFVDDGKPSECSLLKGVVINSKTLGDPQVLEFIKEAGSLLKNEQPDTQSSGDADQGGDVIGYKDVGRFDLLTCNLQPEKSELVAKLKEVSGMTVCAGDDILGPKVKQGKWRLSKDGYDAARWYFDEQKLKEWQVSAVTTSAEAGGCCAIS